MTCPNNSVRQRQNLEKRQNVTPTKPSDSCFVLNHIYLFGAWEGACTWPNTSMEVKDNLQGVGIFLPLCRSQGSHFRFSGLAIGAFTCWANSLAQILCQLWTPTCIFLKPTGFNVILFSLLFPGPVDSKNVHPKCVLGKAMDAVGNRVWGHLGLWMRVQSQSPSIAFSSSALQGMCFSFSNKTHP